MAPVIRWRRAHDDGRTAGNFSDEPGEADPRRKGRERRNCPFQNLIRAGVRPGRAVADVARGFHDVLTNAVGRFLYRNLILFRTGYGSQLFEVGDESRGTTLASTTFECPAATTTCRSRPNGFERSGLIGPHFRKHLDLSHE